jgi:hypothetical protein
VHLGEDRDKDPRLLVSSSWKQARRPVSGDGRGRGLP